MNPDEKCSFCGKPRGELRKLIAGPKAFICDGCVFLSYNIITAEEGDAWGKEFEAKFEGQLTALRAKNES